MKAYEAPFPSPKYKMGCRAMPSHVPIIPDKSLDAQKQAREFYNKTNKPFLSVDLVRFNLIKFRSLKSL